MNHGHLFHEVFPGYSLLLGLVDLGTLLWLVTYLFAIRQGFKEKTYSIPLVPIALNFTWEILAAFHMKAPVPAWHIGDVIWMCTDAIIVYQLFRYGRDRQVIPELRQFYYPVLLATFALAFAGQYTFTTAFDDRLGFEDSYVINFVMSVCFIFMYFTRREASDLTYYIAWGKLFGTGIISVALVGLMPWFYSDSNHRIRPFMGLLYLACFALDAVYVLLLAKARGELVIGGEGSRGAVPASAGLGQG